MWNVIEIRPVWNEVYRADGRADRHDEANNGFSQFCQHPQKGLIVAVTR